MISNSNYQEVLHATILSLGVLIMLLTKSFFWLPLFALFGFCVLLFSNRHTLLAIKPLGGYANWVTLFRLSMLIMLGFYHEYIAFHWVGVLGLIILCLDGLDGFLARKFNQSSDFGGRLDGETDAYFVLQFSCFLFHYDVMGWWVLWPGILRYFYVLSSSILWRELKAEPVSYLRKTIAVIIMSALLIPFVITQNIAQPVVILATVAVSFSFGKSYLYQYQNN